MTTVWALWKFTGSDYADGECSDRLLGLFSTEAAANAAARFYRRMCECDADDTHATELPLGVILPFNAASKETLAES